MFFSAIKIGMRMLHKRRLTYMSICQVLYGLVLEALLRQQKKEERTDTQTHMYRKSGYRWAVFTLIE